MKTTSHQDISSAIQHFHLNDSVISLHGSLRSFGRLQGGAQTLVEAFLAEGCTLLVPTFTYFCEVPTPPKHQLRRNGTTYPAFDTKNTISYDKNTTLISKEMGAIPAYVLSMGSHVRGSHPLNSFAAVGPKAKELIESQTNENVYAPFKAMVSAKKSFLLLAGVDLTSATAVHYAEERAGRNLFRRWAKIGDQIVETSVGSCSNGFNRLHDKLTEIEMVAKSGESTWRIYPFKPFLKITTQTIIDEPNITRCANPACERCPDAVLGGPFLDQSAFSIQQKR